MSMARPCAKAGCRALVGISQRYCTAHIVAPPTIAFPGHDKPKPSSTAQGYTYRWQKARAAFLAAHPLCQCDDCKHAICPLAATVVDHIKPHRGDKELFWNQRNWQAMAKTCHDKKTAKEDGGFGNPRNILKD